MPDARGVPRRVFVGFVCLLIAPIAGVVAGGSMPNPAGDGPGAGQLVVGVAVPVLVTLGAASAARLSRTRTVLWLAASLLATAALVVLLAWLVDAWLAT